MGGGGSTSGGSGNSGKVDYPTYIKESHKYLLAGVGDDPYNGSADNGVFSSIEDAKLSNPFTSVSAFDPSSYLTAAMDQFTIYADEVAAIDPLVLWQDFYTTGREVLQEDESLTWEEYATRAIAEADDKYKTGEEFIEAVDQQRILSLKEMSDQKQRTLGSLADQNAERSSAAILSVALIEAGFIRTLGLVGQEKQFGCVDTRIEFVHKSITQAIDIDSKKKKQAMQTAMQVSTLLSRRFVQLYDSSKLSAGLNSMKIAALKDKVDQQQDIDIDTAEWKLKLWQYGANVLNFRKTVTYGNTSTQPNVPIRWVARAMIGEIVLDAFFPGLGYFASLGKGFLDPDQFATAQTIIDYTDPISWAFGGGPGGWF